MDMSRSLISSVWARLGENALSSDPHMPHGI